MNHYFAQSQTIEVSRISNDGWWLENTLEHVAKGTALGHDFTQHRYTPSQEGMIARFDRETNVWADEIEDMTWKPFWGEHGQCYVIGTPDGDYPGWAIIDEPPAYDEAKQTVWHQNGSWKVYDILLGHPYFDEYGLELVVSDYNFELPAMHTWQAPPVTKRGYAVKLIDGQWQTLLDHREARAYAKDRDNPAHQDHEITELGALDDAYTLEPYDPFDSWIDGQGWVYDIERHRPYKIEEEKGWRQTQLTRVLDRIDQYEKDQNYPIELRTSPINNETDFKKLLGDRKVLCDYPSSEGFPFSQRPTLSGLTA